VGFRHPVRAALVFLHLFSPRDPESLRDPMRDDIEIVAYQRISLL